MINNNKKGECVKVQDTGAEIGIKLNNVLTAITIAVLIWIGTSILNVKEEVALLRTEYAVGKVELDHIRRQLEAHVENKSIHVTGYRDAN